MNTNEIIFTLKDINIEITKIIVKIIVIIKLLTEILYVIVIFLLVKRIMGL